MASTLNYTFTTQEELERLFSSQAIEYRRDDFDVSDPEYLSVLEEIIDQATLEAKAILNKIFDDVDLNGNLWVRRRCTIIGCYLFSIRRGNDSQYFQEYLDALSDLEGLVEGEYYLGLPVSTPRTAMFNVHTDNRFPVAPIRVDIYTSTSTSGPRFFQWFRPYYWI